MPYKGDKGDKNAARPPEGSLVETRCLIKGPKSAIVPRSEPKSRTGFGVPRKKRGGSRPKTDEVKMVLYSRGVWNALFSLAVY